MRTAVRAAALREAREGALQVADGLVVAVGTALVG